MQHGAQPFIADEKTKKTPLHIAIENGQFNSVTILCKAATQAQIDGLNIMWDSEGQSVLHYSAVTQGNAALYIKYFVEKCKLSVFSKNRQGMTAR